MESGSGNNKYLLTIAIPTWNRANTLNIALGQLLPQVAEFKDEIEIIVSDNASGDNTKEIVNEYLNIYTDIHFIYNRNSENIQFFGNFIKCRELSGGKYLWLLSDDDFVLSNIVSTIMQKLSAKNFYSAIYLKNDHNINSLECCVFHFEELLRRETFNLSLISSIILLNKNADDDFLFKKYSGNAFIGFIFLLNATRYNENMLQIKGKCLELSKDIPKGYNYFDVFINHMSNVFDYMYFINVPPNTINYFRKSFLIRFIRPIYFLFKADGKLSFGNFDVISIDVVEKWIQNKYFDLWKFWVQFYPLYLIPSVIFRIAIKSRRFIKGKVNLFFGNFKYYNSAKK